MTDPLWFDPAESGYAPAAGIVEAEVAIVGGGLTGVGAAYTLRDAGAEVVLVEGRTLASGASGRNAGFVLAGPAMPFGDACELVGFEGACSLWRLTVENNRLMANLIEEFGLDCEYLRRGSMSLAASEQEMRRLIVTSDRMREAGFSVCVVCADELPRPFDRLYAGGLYHPGNGEINPGAFVRGIARKVSPSVRIFERSPIREIRFGDPHVLVTQDGEVRAKIVIIATNAYTTNLIPSAPIAPTRGQVVATRRLTRVVVPFPMYADHGYQYWRQTPDGRLVVGGWRNLDMPTEVGTDEVLHGEIQATLDAFCYRIAGREATVEYRWAGIMGFTPDTLPLAGALPGQSGVYIAAGYSGHGVSMAFSCGARVAAQAIGRASELPASLHPGRYLAATVGSTVAASHQGGNAGAGM